MKKMLYWDWVKSEAIDIKSDGCSDVPDFHLKCCLEHDLSYWYAKCPKSAFNSYLLDEDDIWLRAKSLKQSDADARFRRCIQQDSIFGRFSPMSWWRFFALKIFGGKAWSQHRKLDG